MSCGVYKITNKINNKCYIGSSKNVERRLKQHQNKSLWLDQPNNALYQDFQKYGLENFDFEILEKCEEDRRVQLEFNYIMNLNPEYNKQKKLNSKKIYKSQVCGIYKIENTITKNFYIGSSTNIHNRWISHKSKATWNKRPNSKLYRDFINFGIDNFNFSILEECGRDILKEKEQYYIELLKPTLNNIEAYRTVDSNKEYKKNWSLENKEHLKNYKKQYNAQNKTKLQEHENFLYSRLCEYEGEVLTLNALTKRFARKGIKGTYKKAEEYLINENKSN